MLILAFFLELLLCCFVALFGCWDNYEWEWEKSTFLLLLFSWKKKESLSYISQKIVLENLSEMIILFLEEPKQWIV